MPVSSRPPIHRFLPRELGPKPWGTELLIASSPDWTGKILTMRAGHKGGLQYHVQKHEAFHLVSGRAVVRYDAGDGVLTAVIMYPGETYQVPPGCVHQVEALEDSVFFEVSTPHFDDRVYAGTMYGLGPFGHAS